MINPDNHKGSDINVYHNGKKVGEMQSINVGNDSIKDRIDNDHTYHKATENQAARYEAIRAKAKEFAHLIADIVPNGRELSTSLTKIEEAVFWANAGIARNE